MYNSKLKLLSPFQSKEAWEGVMRRCLFQFVSFQIVSYSQVDFQHLLHQYASYFFNCWIEFSWIGSQFNEIFIQFKLDLRIWIKFESNPTSIQVACNFIQYFDLNGTQFSQGQIIFPFNWSLDLDLILTTSAQQHWPRACL